jgi:predicted DNA-binding transcriptional regulator AlpA
MRFGDRQMSEVLSTEQTAQQLNLGRSTLEKWRLTGQGPKFIKLGRRRVGYLKTAIDAWIASRPLLASTSENGLRPAPPKN